MTERFPLAPAVTEENRGVDPDVLRDIGYELPFDHIPEEATASVADAPEAQSDNVVGIEDAPGVLQERAAVRMTRNHPATGRRLREMPRQGADNAPKEKFDPDQEHQEASVIGLAAAREALRQRRGDQ